MENKSSTWYIKKYLLVATKQTKDTLKKGVKSSQIRKILSPYFVCQFVYYI